MKLNELPDEVKEYAVDAYLGNEIGSDQYRDAQPYHGLGVAADYLGNASMTQGLKEDELAMIKEVRDWLDAILKDSEGITIETAPNGMVLASEMYPGVDALEPVLRRAFNRMIENGVHPYETDADELLEDYEDWKKRGK